MWAIIKLGKDGVIFLLLKAEPTSLSWHMPTLEISTLQLILLKKEVMGKTESLFLCGAAYRAGLRCVWECLSDFPVQE